jgi:hypothetical protein
MSLGVDRLLGEVAFERRVQRRITVGCRHQDDE